MSTYHDRRGLLVTADNADAVHHLDDAVRGLLAHSRHTPADLSRALEADPDFVLAHAAKGFLMKILGQAAFDPVARTCLQIAQAALADRGGTDRERAFVAGLRSLCAGEFIDAICHLERQLPDNPHDALAIKLSHALRFMLGDCQGMRASTHRYLHAWHEGMPDFGFLLGCHAFGLEETAEYAEAERVGRRAVDLEPTDAWGFHAVAHVMEMTDRPKDGVAWLAANEASLADTNNLAYHVWWHRALFHLSLGDLDAALDLYDTRIRAEQTDDFRDIANGASLLWRLQALGGEVGDRWDELADLAEGHIGDHAVCFADNHYVMALVGAGRSPDHLVASMRDRARQAAGTQGEILADVALPLAEAQAACGRGDLSEALAVFRRMGPAVRRIGGSHAQRDVFVLMTIEAAVAAGDRPTAGALLRDRLRGRPGNAWAQARLAQLGAGQDEPLRGAA